MGKKSNPELVDEENPEWTAADLAKARPATEVMPQIFGAPLALEMLKPRGRPRVVHPKERINIRLLTRLLRTSRRRVTAGRRASTQPCVNSSPNAKDANSQCALKALVGTIFYLFTATAWQRESRAIRAPCCQ